MRKGVVSTERSGLVLCGPRALDAHELAHDEGYTGVLLIDPEGYEVAATADKPFPRPDDGGMFDPSLVDRLDQQRNAGAHLALTPTGYLYAGDRDSLRRAAEATVELQRDDVVFSAPIDVRWLADSHVDALISALDQLPVPTAVMLGGQFDPIQRIKDAVGNLRRLLVECAHVALLRTDLAAFDALAHGAFAASIGTGGSLRHVIPPGQKPYANTTDRSPSVLFPELMAFHKGSTIADAYSDATAPACRCAPCDGRRLDTFDDQGHTKAAQAHGVSVWTGWLAQLCSQQPTLLDRATWWRNQCGGAVQHRRMLTEQLHRPNALPTPPPLRAWAELPPWPYPTTPTRPRTRTTS